MYVGSCEVMAAIFYSVLFFTIFTAKLNEYYEILCIIQNNKDKLEIKNNFIDKLSEDFNRLSKRVIPKPTHCHPMNFKNHPFKIFSSKSIKMARTKQTAKKTWKCSLDLTWKQREDLGTRAKDKKDIKTAPPLGQPIYKMNSQGKWIRMYNNDNIDKKTYIQQKLSCINYVKLKRDRTLSIKIKMQHSKKQKIH